MSSIKNLLKILIGICLLIILINLVFKIFHKKQNILTSAKISLAKVADMAELRVSEYTYNSIAKKCKYMCTGNDELDEFDYFISYKGKVNVGIDFTQITFELDEENKKLIVVLPEPTITGYNVDIGKLNYIFDNKKSNKADELNNAYNICLEDLKRKVNDDKVILSVAKENSEFVIKEFYKSWLNNYYDGYTLEVR